MQRLEDSGAVRPIYGSLGVKRLKERLSAWRCIQGDTFNRIEFIRVYMTFCNGIGRSS